MATEARVNERTRIARELHDTLLQSFQGLMFSFQAARNLLPGRTEEAIRTLEGAIHKGDEAIAEGRDAIQGLRANPALESNLEHQLTAAGKELAKSSSAEGDPPKFHVTVEGARQPLSPLCRTMSTGLHARSFGTQCTMRTPAGSRPKSPTTANSSGRIRDNGKGIDRKILEEGAREGTGDYRASRARETHRGAVETLERPWRGHGSRTHRSGPDCL